VDIQHRACRIDGRSCRPWRRGAADTPPRWWRRRRRTGVGRPGAAGRCWWCSEEWWTARSCRTTCGYVHVHVYTIEKCAGGAVTTRLCFPDPTRTAQSQNPAHVPSLPCGVGTCTGAGHSQAALVPTAHARRPLPRAARLPLCRGCGQVSERLGRQTETQPKPSSPSSLLNRRSVPWSFAPRGMVSLTRSNLDDFSRHMERRSGSTLPLLREPSPCAATAKRDTIGEPSSAPETRLPPFACPAPPPTLSRARAHGMG
jgi:hypothetical protein